MKGTFGERGFVTIATGHERYYALARNLLRTYRCFTNEAVPFAIIADRENEYTAEFDRVIVISDASNSYNDKLKLFRDLPYEETIFIDADSLAYGNLNAWWDIFQTGGDFSLFGYAWRDLNCGRGWFVPSGMKEYQKDIRFIPDFNGGVYYMRNTETCGRVFEIANHCAARYHDYKFNGFAEPADEPVIALGMAVCGFEPFDIPGELVFAPPRKKLDADISVPRAVFHPSADRSYPVRLIHFSNYRAQLSFYRNEVIKIGKKCGRVDGMQYDMPNRLRRGRLCISDSVPFGKRVIRKAKRVLHL